MNSKLLASLTALLLCGCAADSKPGFTRTMDGATRDFLWNFRHIQQGMSGEEVRRWLGEPTKIDGDLGGRRLEYWLFITLDQSYPPDNAYLVFFDRTDHVLGAYEPHRYHPDS